MMRAPTKVAGVRRGRASVKLLVAGVVVVVGALGIYAVAMPRSSGTGVAAADLARAAMTTFEVTTTATGDVQAKNQIELRSELDSDTTIVEIKPEGTLVKAGEVVIRLNGDQIKTNIDEEELRVESAKAELVAAENAFEIQKSENESKLRQAGLKLELARLALEQWEKGEVVQKRKDNDLAFDRANRDLERLQKKVVSNDALLKEGFLSQDEYDREYIEFLEAKAALEKAVLARETYESYEYHTDAKSKKSDVDEAVAELARVEQQNEIELTSKDADRINQRRQLQIRQDRLDKLRKQFEACTMIAPSDGLVVYAVSAGRGFMSDDQPLQVGRNVRPRETLVVLPDTSEMVAVVKVHESLAGRIRPGQDASVKIDMLGGQTFAGRVDSIGVMAETGDRWRDPNRREYSVRIALNHGDQRDLRPSMRCEAVVTLGRVQDALAVPVQAVFSEEQLRYVYVPRDGRFARVPVRVGRRSDIFAEITAGLTAGDRVLLRQPGPGEVVVEAWNAETLKLVGFELGEDGKPVSVLRGTPGAMPAGMPDGMRAGDGAGRVSGREGGGPGNAGGPAGPNGERRGNRPRGPRTGEAAGGQRPQRGTGEGGSTGGGAPAEGTSTESGETPPRGG